MRNNIFSLLLFFIVALALPSCSFAREPEANPFQIGQIIYPNEDYARELAQDEFVLVGQGAKVLDITRRLVRVQYADGSVDNLSFQWFRLGDFTLTEEWAMGNPFHNGDEVCAVPDSIREEFPDKGIVTSVDGHFITVDDYWSMIDWAHYQYCQ